MLKRTLAILATLMVIFPVVAGGKKDAPAQDVSSLEKIKYFGTNYTPNAYGKSTDIVSVTGAQYRFSYPCGLMNADLSAGAEYSYNQLRDQILGYDRNTLQRVHLGGGYVQNEWKNKQWSILVGGRPNCM